jgi:predicted DNA-binding transcriptional regulator AlpA
MKSRGTVPNGTPAPAPPPPQPRPPTGPRRLTDDDYLTVAEVAALWHLSAKSVYRRVYDGAVPYINVASSGARQASIRIRRSAAHQYMADRERQEHVA